MKELLLVVSLDKGADSPLPVAIWPEKFWDNIELDSDGIWVVKTGKIGAQYLHEMSVEDFENNYGWPINLALKPGEKMVIRSETKWEPVEED